MVALTCPCCNEAFEVSAGHANRSAAKGAPVYCSRKCSGLARRKFTPEDVKRDQKAEYDRKRREERAEAIKAEKAAYHRRTYDPAKAAQHRKGRMKAHVAYCQRPEYREWKAEYDRKYRAKKDYGEFFEAFLLAMEIRKTCLELADDTEIRRSAGTLNKHQTRRRDYDRTHSNQPEIGALGHP